MTSSFYDVVGRILQYLTMLQSVAKWLYELLGVPCFNGNTALIVKEYAAIVGEGFLVSFLEGAVQKNRKDIKVIHS